MYTIDHIFVRNYTLLIQNGKYTFDQVPVLHNLRQMVYDRLIREGYVFDVEPTI